MSDFTSLIEKLITYKSHQDKRHFLVKYFVNDKENLLLSLELIHFLVNKINQSKQVDKAVAKLRCDSINNLAVVDLIGEYSRSNKTANAIIISFIQTVVDYSNDLLQYYTFLCHLNNEVTVNKYFIDNCCEITTWLKNNDAIFGIYSQNPLIIEYLLSRAYVDIDEINSEIKIKTLSKQGKLELVYKLDDIFQIIRDLESSTKLLGYTHNKGCELTIKYLQFIIGYIQIKICDVRASLSVDLLDKFDADMAHSSKSNTIIQQAIIEHLLHTLKDIKMMLLTYSNTESLVSKIISSSVDDKLKSTILRSADSQLFNPEKNDESSDANDFLKICSYKLYSLGAMLFEDIPVDVASIEAIELHLMSLQDIACSSSRKSCAVFT